MELKNAKLNYLLTLYKSKRNDPMYSFVENAVSFLRHQIETDPDNIYISFNGGKDATVVLFLSVFAYCELQIPLTNIKCIYFDEPRPFQQVDQFIQEMIQLIGFENIKTEKNFIESLSRLKQNRKIQKIIMGSRKTDPYCQNLTELSPSDVQKGYPEFMRVNPIINWNYQQVWKFLLDFQIPFCKLYREGYTYLGNKNNTVQNVHLFNQKTGKYKPAWEGPPEIELESRKKK